MAKKVELNEAELKANLIRFHMKYYVMALPRDHLLANTPIAKLWEFIAAKLVTQNSFPRRPSFIPAAAGLLSTHLPPMMPSP